jgi:NitT/TauT family transport system ATP-binding protein
VLPHATAGGMAGLLELLNERGGKEDLYHLAQDLLMEVDDLFLIVDATVMLGFVTSTSGAVHITSAGKEFAQADITTRKSLFRVALLTRAGLIQRIRNALERKADHALPLEFFRDILDEQLSQEDAQRQIETALNWGRYAEIFVYDSETERLLLNDNSGSANSTENVPLH